MEESVRNVSLLPESRKIIQIDLVTLPTPVKEKGHSGYFPFALLMVEKKPGLVTGMDSLDEAVSSLFDHLENGQPE